MPRLSEENKKDYYLAAMQKRREKLLKESSVLSQHIDELKGEVIALEQQKESFQAGLKATPALQYEIEALDEKIASKQQEIKSKENLQQQIEKHLLAGEKEPVTGKPIKGKQGNTGAYSEGYLAWLAKMVKEDEWDTLEVHFKARKLGLMEEHGQLQKAEQVAYEAAVGGKLGLSPDEPQAKGVLEILAAARSGQRKLEIRLPEAIHLPERYLAVIGKDKWSEKEKQYIGLDKSLVENEKRLKAAKAHLQRLENPIYAKEKEKISTEIAQLEDENKKLKSDMQILAAEMCRLLSPVLLERQQVSAGHEAVYLAAKEEGKAIEALLAALGGDILNLSSRSQFASFDRVHNAENPHRLAKRLFGTAIGLGIIAVSAGLISAKAGWTGAAVFTTAATAVPIFAAISAGVLLIGAFIAWSIAVNRESGPLLAAPSFETSALSTPVKFQADLANLLIPTPKVSMAAAAKVDATIASPPQPEAELSPTAPAA
jgi:predicted nuclease with TOPRIM domain